MANESILMVMPVLASNLGAKEDKKAGTRERNRKAKKETKQYGWQLGESAFFQKDDSTVKYVTYGKNRKTILS